MVAGLIKNNQSNYFFGVEEKQIKYTKSFYRKGSYFFYLVNLVFVDLFFYEIKDFILSLLIYDKKRNEENRCNCLL